MEFIGIVLFYAAPFILVGGLVSLFANAVTSLFD